MSQKELAPWAHRLSAWVSAKRRWGVALLCIVGLMWLAPLGMKWWLVQQLQHALQRGVTVQAVRVHPLSLAIEVQGVSIQNREGGEWLGWQGLTVDVSAQSITQRALVLDALTLHKPRVSVVHLGQGRFDFSDLLDKPASQGPTPLPPFVLREVAIEDGVLRVEDRPHQRTHTVEHFKLQLPNVSSVAGPNGVMLTPELSATVNGAAVHVGGSVQPLADAPHAALALTVAAFDLSSVQAYVPDTVPLRVLRSTLSADLTLEFSQAEGRTALLLAGTTRVQNLALNDAQGQALLMFKNLALTLRQSDVMARHLVFSEVALDEPTVLARINRAGQRNWAMAATPQPTPQPPEPTPAALSLQVDQFTLRSGVLDFADASVSPTVQTHLRDVNAVVKGFSTQANALADATLKATLAPAASLAVQARVQPMAVTSWLDATLEVKKLDLSLFSGYVHKYVGYALDKGQLSMSAHYRIRQKQLQADNHVFIDQLTLGQAMPSPDAIDAPVALGVSLLKNSQGQIDIDLPVSGSVDAPDFSFGGLIAQTVGNLLVKVVTAPLRAVGDLLGGDKKAE